MGKPQIPRFQAARRFLLTRQHYISLSGLQAGAGTRRSAQARVVPLPRSLQCIHALATLGHPVQRTGTQVRRLPEAPNSMIFKDRPRRAGPQAALLHLAVGWLQRRWAALLRTGTPRLNTIYSVAGLIIFMKSLAPLLDPCLHREFSFLGNTAHIPRGQKIPCADNSLYNHRGDS